MAEFDRSKINESDVPTVYRHKPRYDWSTAHLAEKIGQLLSDGVPRTAKEIAHSISQQQNHAIQMSGVNSSLSYGQEHFGFIRLAGNHWTVSNSLARH